MYKNIKRIFTILMVFALNTASYAAVGANDGSAFTTKAEFDALVNTFNEQMDKYENSIVSKIDGAIANYIASRADTRSIILTDYASMTAAYGSEYVTFYNYPTSNPFRSSNKNNNGMAGSYYLYTQGQLGEGSWSVYARLSSAGYETGFGYNSFGSANSLYLLENTTINDSGSGYDDLAVFLTKKNSYKNTIKIKNDWYSNGIGATAHLTTSMLNSGTTKSHTVSISNKNSYAGTFNSTESGAKIAEKTMSPTATISEEWTANANNTFVGAGYPSTNKIPSQTLYAVNNGNKTYFDGDQQTITGCYASNAGGKLVCYINGDSTYGNLTISSGCSWTYKYYWHKIYTTDANKISNYAASMVAGTAVKLYSGIPLTKVNTTGQISFSVIMSNSVGNDTYLTISDEPFDNDNRYSTKAYTSGGKTYDHILYNEKITPGKATEIKFEIANVRDKVNGTMLYYRLSQETYVDQTVKMSMVLDSSISQVTEN